MAYVSELSDMVGTTTFGVYPETVRFRFAPTAYHRIAVHTRAH